MDVVALGTSDLGEARHALAVRLAEFERVVAASRAKPDPSQHAKTIRPLSHVPTQNEVDEAVRAWLSNQERAALPNELRRQELGEEVLQEQEQVRSETKRAMQSRHSPPQLQTQWIKEHFSVIHGWNIPSDNPIGGLPYSRGCASRNRLG